MRDEGGLIIICYVWRIPQNCRQFICFCGLRTI